ncbi:ROK family protein [Alkalibacterium olivapovliticus]|uniref:Beta-glucoside kinase n=1 Tax=Alkalibacterium olivapovliticus TaxID=99907 RepID=A0A2T0W610_9LACT|nr:ROK family protein [Alkalibacterium olivapovliticus]PRY80994.1 beta-glucoside kinase [Alkalibacterium olivapovliticus]
MAIVCFDIGGTDIKYALISDEGEIQSRGSTPTVQTSTEEFISVLVKKIRNYENRTAISGVGISIPGIVDNRSGQTITAGAIWHLYNKNIKKLLSEHFSYPIHVENDARCALVAEMTSGAAKGLQDVVLMTIGTGIGGAIAFNGEIIYGKDFKTGEFGMMRLDIGHHPDGTMHELASTSALIKSYKEKKFLFPSTLVDAKLIIDEISFERETAELVDEWITYLAAGVFNIAASFNPQKIVIGGGISANQKLLPMLLKKLESNPHWNDYKTAIETAFYKNNAGLIGAYSFFTSSEMKEIQL